MGIIHQQGTDDLADTQETTGIEVQRHDEQVHAGRKNQRAENGKKQPLVSFGENRFHGNVFLSFLRN